MSDDENVEAKIARMFIAGASIAAIAAGLELDEDSVSDVVKAELLKAADNRSLFAEDGDTIFVERTDALFRANYPAAMRGDPRSARICIDLLQLQQEVKPKAKQSKVDELAAKRAKRLRRAAAANGGSDAADPGGATVADERG